MQSLIKMLKPKSKKIWKNLFGLVGSWFYFAHRKSKSNAAEQMQFFRAQNDTLGSHKLPYLSLFGVKETMRNGSSNRNNESSVEGRFKGSAQASLVAISHKRWTSVDRGNPHWMLELCKFHGVIVFNTFTLPFVMWNTFPLHALSFFSQSGQRIFTFLAFLFILNIWKSISAQVH